MVDGCVSSVSVVGLLSLGEDDDGVEREVELG